MKRASNNTKSVDPIWGAEIGQGDILARNVLMHYLAIGFEIVIGVLMLPFNISHLGKSAYGLWVLTASITFYFSMLDLGYGSAQVKFAAQYRGLRDRKALNQIASTMFFLFSMIGVVAYLIAIVLAANVESLFNITPEQVTTGRTILLMLGAYVALGFPFSVFGGIVNGFQRNYLNGVVAIMTSVTVALVNVGVLLSGYGLIELVAATLSVRILSYFGYRLNAYRVFPGLRIRPRYFRLTRLREVTGFSAFILLIDLANKVNYSTDTIVIGAFLSTTLVAIWAVAQRLIETAQSLTNQLNGVLFPIVVDNATAGEDDRLRMVLLQGTKLSLAMVILVATGLALLAHSVVLAWVGPTFLESVPVIYILALAVTIRVGSATSTTILKGAGQHRLLAISSLVMAFMNLALSIAMVRSLGLIGVALGTLIPLALISLFVIFPAACRRVNLPIRQVLTSAVWPALWPAIFVGLFLAFTRDLTRANPLSIAVQAVAAGLIYAGLFLRFAIDRKESRWYIGKAKRVLQARLAPAA